jgi:hypothetical protein
VTDARIRLFELACEAAFLIATSPDPAVARQKFNDDVTDELVAGRRNLEGSAGLREAFRDAMGYSRKVPDALGEQDRTRALPGATAGDLSSPRGSTPSCSPSARARVGWRLFGGGHA